MSERAVRVLVVDEEQALSDVIRLALQLEGWSVDVAASGTAALTAVTTTHPDIILLDMMLPDMIGTEVVARLREGGITTPVVFLTGRASLDDRLAGFGAGGDEYITKPFGLDELVFRLEPIVRRLGLGPHSRTLGDLLFDESTSEVWRDGERMVITPLEFEMLRVLYDNGGTAVSLGSIVRSVAAKGIRLPRELAQRLLERMGTTLNANRRPVLHAASPGEWMLATA